MAKLFDTHAHYTDERLRDTELLTQALAGEIGGIVTVASDLDDAEACIALAAAHENVWAAAGIHPHECGKAGALPAAMERLHTLLKEEKAVAIGEIGLDYHYDFSDRETQMRFFRSQMDLAAETGLPVIIHDREAHGDVFDIIRAYRGRVRGILHSCSAAREQVREYVKMGWYISKTGSLSKQTVPILRRSPCAGSSITAAICTIPPPAPPSFWAWNTKPSARRKPLTPALFSKFKYTAYNI